MTAKNSNTLENIKQTDSKNSNSQYNLHQKSQFNIETGYQIPNLPLEFEKEIKSQKGNFKSQENIPQNNKSGSQLSEENNKNIQSNIEQGEKKPKSTKWSMELENVLKNFESLSKIKNAKSYNQHREGRNSIPHFETHQREEHHVNSQLGIKQEISKINDWKSEYDNVLGNHWYTTQNSETFESSVNFKKGFGSGEINRNVAEITQESGSNKQNKQSKVTDWSLEFENSFKKFNNAKDTNQEGKIYEKTNWFENNFGGKDTNINTQEGIGQNGNENSNVQSNIQQKG